MEIPLQQLFLNIQYCHFLLESVLTEAALITVLTEILLEKGPLPVGELGKILTELTSNASISGKLKETFGGLKKFVERVEEHFIVSHDHPFNPHVILKSTLSPSHMEMIQRGVFPLQSIVKSKKVIFYLILAIAVDNECFYWKQIATTKKKRLPFGPEKAVSTYATAPQTAFPAETTSFGAPAATTAPFPVRTSPINPAAQPYVPRNPRLDPQAPVFAMDNRNGLHTGPGFTPDNMYRPTASPSMRHYGGNLDTASNNSLHSLGGSRMLDGGLGPSSLNRPIIGTQSAPKNNAVNGGNNFVGDRDFNKNYFLSGVGGNKDLDIDGLYQGQGFNSSRTPLHSEYDMNDSFGRRINNPLSLQQPTNFRNQDAPQFNVVDDNNSGLYSFGREGILGARNGNNYDLQQPNFPFGGNQSNW